ncbi:hypothetical protein OCU04_010578 [Sclerotinia nivalis]|uniref:Uncharacterized protein n=1 Tax=Sclerotinia nivalis TaxID=352851 RepID=A0A9X0AD82_9HELO|nr:hypothetical protein OCU04_010578 [Sclerotinia nivalis]
MIDPGQVEGKIYRCKFWGDIDEKLMTEEIRGYIYRLRQAHVLCLGDVRDREDFVKVMTIKASWELEENQEYLPLLPTPKDSYPIRIRLRNKLGCYDYTHWVRRYAHLAPQTYLRIDETYEVSILLLEELVDQYGCAMQIKARHHGGLAELRDYVRRRDQARVSESVGQRARQDQEREEIFIKAMDAIETLSVIQEN